MEEEFKKSTARFDHYNSYDIPNAYVAPSLNDMPSDIEQL